MEDYLISSHNTFTYCKPRNFLSWFGIPIGRCQNKDLSSQILTGVRVLDIRVRFDGSGYIYLCHGLFEVKLEIPVKEFPSNKLVLTDKFKYPNFIDWLIEQVNIYCPKDEKFYFRLVLETNKVDVIQEMWFVNFCKDFYNKIQNTNMFLLGCVRKFDWKYLFTYSEQCLPTFQHISSYSVYEESIKVRWYEKICPWLYAKRTNKKFLENIEKNVYKNYKILAYDFV